MKIKSKKHKKYVTKEKPKFEDHQNCLKTTQLEKKKRRRRKLEKIKLRKTILEKIKENLSKSINQY